MICYICKDAAQIADNAEYELPLDEVKALHAPCKGETHCDCQHKPTALMPSGSRAQRRE
jgi:hypothetical protein